MYNNLMLKFIFRIVTFLVCSLSVLGNSHALEVEIVPEEVIPGGVFILKVRENRTIPLEAQFLDRKIRFHEAEDHLLALIPVSIDTSPEEHKIIIRDGDNTKYVSIRVRPYRFVTKRLTLPEEKVTLSPENERRVAREYSLLKELWRKHTAKAWNGRFVPPTSTTISEEFGVRRIINNKKNSIHRGVDYKGDIGTPVRAINSGTVVLRENLFYGGNTLVIDHGMGLFSIYMHLSRFNVQVGEKVSKNQTIGFIGATGRVTGPHLHMSVKLQGVSINPMALMDLEL